MRLSISNIAWERDQDSEVAALLQNLGVTVIDTAPGKYFPDPQNASQSEITAVRQWWAQRGFSIYGMQSLLFGTQGLNVFGDADCQNRLLAHLEHICRIAEGLGVKRLVFGSPKNRDRSGLSDQEARDTALAFFERLGKIAVNHGVVITLEPNPVCYGTNWITASKEAFDFVTELGNPGIAMQLDTGTVLTNNESTAVITEVKSAVGHVHLSEKQLLPVKTGEKAHDQIFEEALGCPVEVAAIEMLTKGQGDPLKTIELSVRAVQKLMQNKI